MKTPTGPQLDQIRTLSRYLLASCHKDPMPPCDPYDHGAIIARLSFYTTPAAEVSSHVNYQLYGIIARTYFLSGT